MARLFLPCALQHSSLPDLQEGLSWSLGVQDAQFRTSWSGFQGLLFPTRRLKSRSPLSRPASPLVSPGLHRGESGAVRPRGSRSFGGSVLVGCFRMHDSGDSGVSSGGPWISSSLHVEGVLTTRGLYLTGRGGHDHVLLFGVSLRTWIPPKSLNPKPLNP